MGASRRYRGIGFRSELSRVDIKMVSISRVLRVDSDVFGVCDVEAFGFELGVE